MEAAEEEFQLRKQKGKKDALSVYLKLFEKPIVFQHLTVTNIKTNFFRKQLVIMFMDS